MSVVLSQKHLHIQCWKVRWTNGQIKTLIMILWAWLVPQRTLLLVSDLPSCSGFSYFRQVFKSSVFPNFSSKGLLKGLNIVAAQLLSVEDHSDAVSDRTMEKYLYLFKYANKLGFYIRKYVICGENPLEQICIALNKKSSRNIMQCHMIAHYYRKICFRNCKHMFKSLYWLISLNNCISTVAWNKYNCPLPDFFYYWIFVRLNGLKCNIRQRKPK